MRTSKRHRRRKDDKKRYIYKQPYPGVWTEEINQIPTVEVKKNGMSCNKNRGK